MRSRIACALALAAISSTARAAAAQSVERVGLETTVSVDQFAGDLAVNRPNIIVDVTAFVRLGDEWQIYVRPWFRQPRTPEWDTQIYQAALRYEHQGRVATRVEAGLIGSPVGLGMADTSPSTNPTISPHLSYFTPMLPFDTGGARVNPIASTYPPGAQLTLSTNRWDVRAALVSSAPTRIFVLGANGNPAATPVIEAGAGITPAMGLRLGVSLAHGAYLTRSELMGSTSNRQMTMVGVEGEYAFGYTKLSGELIRDTFETAIGPLTAFEWFLQGTHTLSPRWFVAGRHEGTAAPARSNTPIFRAQPTLEIVEATLGFRLTPELTLRGSYFTRQFYGRTTWDRQAGAQIVWAHRWW